MVVLIDKLPVFGNNKKKKVIEAGYWFGGMAGV